MKLSPSSLWSSQKHGNLSWKPPHLTAKAAAIETTVLLAVLEWVLWTDSKHVLSQSARTAGTFMLVCVVVTLLLRQRPNLSDLGVAPSNWLAGIPTLMAATITAMLAITILGFSLGTIGNVENFPHWVRRNWHLEGLQQLLLQVLLVPRLTLILSDRRRLVSTVAAAIFGLLHAPNVPLVILTAVAAFLWCEWFRRFRNLPALWLSHFLVAATLLYCLNTPALATLRVGISYFF